MLCIVLKFSRPLRANPDLRDYSGKKAGLSKTLFIIFVCTHSLAETNCCKNRQKSQPILSAHLILAQTTCRPISPECSWRRRRCSRLKVGLYLVSVTFCKSLLCVLVLPRSLQPGNIKFVACSSGHRVFWKTVLAHNHFPLDDAKRRNKKHLSLGCRKIRHWEVPKPIYLLLFWLAEFK